MNLDNSNNVPDKREGRPTAGHKQALSDEVLSIIESTQARVDKNFCSFIVKQGWNNATAARNLGLTDSQMSKIMKGDQHVSMGLCVRLHYQCGVELTLFIAGDTAAVPDFHPVVERAVKILKTIL